MATANSVRGNSSASAAALADLAVPDTSAAGQALSWTAASGFVAKSNLVFSLAPTTTAATSYTQLTNDTSIIVNAAGTCTLTLLAAASWSGRVVRIKTVANQTVVSATSNVVPIGSTTAGTAILAGTAGKYAVLVSDGSNWITMASN